MLSFLDKIPFSTPRIRRIVFWLLMVLIFYTLFGFFAVPPLLKNFTVKELTQNLHRQTRVEEVYFNPFTFRIEVTGLTVDKKEGKGELMSVAHMEAAPSISTIWELAPVIAYLKLDKFKLDMTFYGKGKYSVSDLMVTKETKDSPPTKNTDTIFPFALYGFELTNSTVVFNDMPRNKVHKITDINLRVPFTSSIQDKVKEFTQPKFTAVVNGDPIELKGKTLPFDKTLLTEFELGAEKVDLHQYWKYLPFKTPLKLKSGRFTSDISLFFERPEDKRMQFYLGGGGKLTNLVLETAQDGTVFSMKELSFDMERFSMGDNALKLKNVTMEKPFFKVIRESRAGINWIRYLPGHDGAVAQPAPDQPATAEGEPATAPAAATEDKPEDTVAAKKARAPDNDAFRLDVGNFSIKDGSFELEDRFVKNGFDRTYDHLEFNVSHLSTRKGEPCDFDGSLKSQGTIAVKGTAVLAPLSVQATVSGKDLPLSAYGTYINQAQPLVVSEGTTGFSVDLKVDDKDGKQEITASNGSLTVDNLAVHKPGVKQSSFSMTNLSISGAGADLQTRIAQVGEIKITAPSVRVVREKDGQIDLQKLLMPKSGEKQETGKSAEEPTSSDDSPGWQARVDHLLIQEASADFRDLSVKNKARLGLRKGKVEVTDFTTEKGARIPFSVSGGWTGGGWFSVTGKATLDPLAVNGRVQAKKLGLKPLDSYLAQETELLIAKGAVSADLRYTFEDKDKPEVTAKGEASLTDLETKTTFSDNELVGIDSLEVKDLDFANEPNRLTIGEIVLDGPRASVAFAEDGQLNIRRALRLSTPEPVEMEGAEAQAAEGQKEQPADSRVVEAKGAESVQEPGSDGPSAENEEPATPFKTLEIKKISMKNGAVHFTDKSVHPGFSTKMTAMTLTLTNIDQTPESRPKLDFKANIGPTPMSLSGVLNPVITPMYSDMTLSINGMELVPLTPYTLKNLAYPIEKGRLYADVTFKTENEELDAQTKFFIEQLVMGAKDVRPDAPNIPVKFGLALLQDSNGDMQLNLPISGRLDDPNFRIGGIVFQAIINLLFKALTSPFALIGSMFGGGEDMDFVVFEPGRYQIDDGGAQKLDTVIKALTERTKLKLEVDGCIDSAADTNGLAQVIFERKIKAAKYDSLSRSEKAATTIDQVEVKSEEYEDMLYEAYAAEPDEEGVKPTTLFITDKRPVPEMEKFIRDRIVVTDEMLHDLAMKRANAIKSYIIEKNPELADRVFLVDREDAEGKTGVPKHRADLGID